MYVNGSLQTIQTRKCLIITPGNDHYSDHNDDDTKDGNNDADKEGIEI